MVAFPIHTWSVIATNTIIHSNLLLKGRVPGTRDQFQYSLFSRECIWKLIELHELYFVHFNLKMKLKWFFKFLFHDNLTWIFKNGWKNYTFIFVMCVVSYRFVYRTSNAIRSYQKHSMIERDELQKNLLDNPKRNTLEINMLANSWFTKSLSERAMI